MEVIAKLADMGLFGLTISETHGGFGLSKAAMVVVSEELSRGYIAVGSLGTRSEIAAELILRGGTETRKDEWLPKNYQRADFADGSVYRTKYRVRSGCFADASSAGGGLADHGEQDLEHPHLARARDNADGADGAGQSGLPGT